MEASENGKIKEVGGMKLRPRISGYAGGRGGAVFFASRFTFYCCCRSICFILRGVPDAGIFYEEDFI